MNEEELSEILKVYQEETDGQVVMVGYNRRFSPFTAKVLEFFTGRQAPMMLQCRVNAGPVPREHWVHDEWEGGGRIIGEVCHFVDLCQCLTGSSPVSVYARRLSGETDDVAITVTFTDGSVATIVYTAGGDKAYSRERFELFADQSVVVLDDFREVELVRNGSKKRIRRLNQDMGYTGELNTFFDAVRGKRPFPIPFADYAVSTLTTFKILESLTKGLPVPVDLA